MAVKSPQEPTCLHTPGLDLPFLSIRARDRSSPIWGNDDLLHHTVVLLAFGIPQGGDVVVRGQIPHADASTHSAS